MLLRPKKYGVFFLIMIVFTIYVQGRAQNSSSDYKAQALFIYNFTKYISWSSTSGEEFVITTFFNSPINPYLVELGKVKKVGNKSIRVNIINSFEEVGTTDILYVDSSIPIKIEEAKLGNMLIVTEDKTIQEAYSCINFQKVNNSYKFEIHLGNLTKRNLSASSMLLNLALRVIK